MKLNEINNVFYHGTNIKNVPTILKHGLDPSQSVHAHDERMNDVDGFGPPYHFVYLSQSINCAKSFAPGGADNNRPATEMAIFEITLPTTLQKKLIFDRGEFVRAPFIIKPRYIKRII